MSAPYYQQKRTKYQKDADTIIQELGLIENSNKSIKPGNLKRRRLLPSGFWTKCDVQPDLSIKKYDNTEESIPQFDTLIDFSKQLLTNMAYSGVNEKYSRLITRYVMGAYLVKLPLLLVGNTAEQMAAAISMSTCGKMPSIIFIPTGFNDISSLINVINSQESDCVVLRNATEFLDESIFIRLKEEVISKQLLFSVSIVDSISLFNPKLFSYVGIIDCETCWQYLCDPKLNPAKYMNTGNPELNIEASNQCIELLNNFSKVLKLNKGYNISRAEFITILNENKINITPQTTYTYLFPILHELDVISSILNKKEDFMKILENLPDKKSYYLMKTTLDERIGL